MPISEMSIPREKRVFELKMEFGSCITVRAKYLVTNESVKIFADCCDRND